MRKALSILLVLALLFALAACAGGNGDNGDNNNKLEYRREENGRREQHRHREALLQIIQVIS